MLPRLTSDIHLSVSVPQAAKIADIPQCVQLIRVPQLTRWDLTQNVFRGQARRITEEVILASTGQGGRANSGGQWRWICVPFGEVNACTKECRL